MPSSDCTQNLTIKVFYYHSIIFPINFYSSSYELSEQSYNFYFLLLREIDSSKSRIPHTPFEDEELLLDEEGVF
jgi:methionyl-tRNA synthetase